MKYENLKLLIILLSDFDMAGWYGTKGERPGRCPRDWSYPAMRNNHLENIENNLEKNQCRGKITLPPYGQYICVFFYNIGHTGFARVSFK